MKRVLYFILIGIFFVGNTLNINATNKEQGDLFEDCLDDAVLDYEITGSLESAIDYYNNCVDEALKELENFELKR